MKFAIVGAGAMGCLFGARLTESNHEVALIDVSRETVEVLSANGLIVEDKSGNEKNHPVRAYTSSTRERRRISLRVTVALELVVKIGVRTVRKTVTINNLLST